MLSFEGFTCFLLWHSSFSSLCNSDSFYFIHEFRLESFSLQSSSLFILLISYSFLLQCRSLLEKELDHYVHKPRQIQVIIIIIIRHAWKRGRAGLPISRRLCFAPSSRPSVIQGLQLSGHLLLLSTMCYGVGLADASIRGGICAWRLALPVWSRNPRIDEQCAKKVLGAARGTRLLTGCKPVLRRMVILVTLSIHPIPRVLR